MKKLLFICVIIIGQTLCAQNNTIDYSTLKYSKEWQAKADAGDPKAQYVVGYCYNWGIGISQNEKKAFEWYKKATEGGNVDAMFRMGQCYEFGDGVKENKKKAFEWYHKAAEKGNVYAMFHTGQCYKLGDGVKENKVKAFEWYQKAAEKGYISAQLSLSDCYLSGYGIVKDKNKAIEILEELAVKGETKALKKIADLYYSDFLNDSTLYEKALEWNLKVANAYMETPEEDNIGAIYNLGRIYEALKQGDESIKWYLKYIENQKDDKLRALGAEMIGIKYHYGSKELGITRNLGLAHKYFTNAIEWGYKPSGWDDLIKKMQEIEKKGDDFSKNNEFLKAEEQYKLIADGNATIVKKLGDLYWEKSKDYISLYKDEAFEMWKKAAELGSTDAKYLYYEHCYYRDKELALEFLKQAAEANHTASQYELSKYFYSNNQEKERLFWLEKAAKAGHAEAKEDLRFHTSINDRSILNAFLKEQRTNELGELYNAGLAYSKEGNYEKAVEIWLPVAEEGLPEAQNAMGVAYHYGQGVSQNTNMAVQWYDKAIAQGYKLAQKNKQNLLSPPKEVNQNNGWAIAATILQALSDGINTYNQITNSQKQPISTPNNTINQSQQNKNNDVPSYSVNDCNKRQKNYNEDVEQVKYWMSRYKDQWVTYYKDKAAGKTGALYNVNVSDQFKQIQHYQGRMREHRKICPSISQSELETITPKTYIKKTWGIDVP